jgi:dihydrofolate reductase
MNMIVAFCKNRGIGYKNKLPWNLPNELKYFKKKTSKGDNNVVIMGRNTWDSLYSKPLINRKNIILSSSLPDDEIKNCKNTYVNSDFNELNDTIDNLINQNKKIWLIGGKSIYDYYIEDPKLEKIYVTYVNNLFACDVKFPEIPNHFNLSITSSLFSENDINYYYKIYKNQNSNVR